MFIKMVRFALVWPLLWLAGQAVAQAESADWVAGRRIYMEGVLPDGQLLKGVRADIGQVSGSAAACVNCHRGSGLGQVEGNIIVPPISGAALFESKGVVVRQDSRFVRGLSAPHTPYDASSLATSLREGRDVAGRTMSAVMPRFALSDEQLRQLTVYLRTLSATWSPGAEPDKVHVATVITPDVAPAHRDAFLATLKTALAQINMNVHAGLRQKISAVERLTNSRRPLALEVWQLEGAPESWPAQLQRFQDARPVFAVLSGLGNAEWFPVQSFCDKNQVVCWFPSLNLIPEQAAQSSFSVYFSAGVVTEAQVIAAQVAKSKQKVVQLVGASPVAQSAAKALRAALPGHAAVTDIALPWGDGAKLLPALAEAQTVVVWLSAEELASVRAQLPSVPQLFLSGTLLGETPPEWATALSQHATLVQTLEIPKIRDANLMRFDAWREGSHVPLVDRKMQSEVYFAVRSFVTILRGALNNLHTQYLVERAEATLSMVEAMQVQEEIQSLMMAPVNKRPVTMDQLPKVDTASATAYIDVLHRRASTTVYPRLSLAPGQRIASKGAYLYHIPVNSSDPSPDPEWVTP